MEICKIFQTIGEKIYSTNEISTNEKRQISVAVKSSPVPPARELPE